MTDRENLVEMINNAADLCPNELDVIADHLIDMGVTIRPKGRWVVKPLDGTEDLLLPHCSECGKPHAREWNFCNECGADMREA